MRYGLTFHTGPAAERIRMTRGVRPDAIDIMCAASNFPQCRLGRELASGSPCDIPPGSRSDAPQSCSGLPVLIANCAAKAVPSAANIHVIASARALGELTP